MVQQPTSKSDGSLRINKITYFESRELGTGCLGTKVFEGKFEGNRKVAVKRVIAQFWSKVDNEQALFLQTDDHENVLRYFTTERCSRYCYIAL